MALNRLSDDSCTYGKALRQSIDPLAYTLDPVQYEHCRTCRMRLGTVGGSTVSHVSGALLVDTESELRNQTRAASKCPENKFTPGRDYVVRGMRHLPDCQMVHYKPTPAARWAPPGGCGA